MKLSHFTFLRLINEFKVVKLAQIIDKCEIGKPDLDISSFIIKNT